MLRHALACLTALAVAACMGPQAPRERYGRFLQPVANPGKVIATELAFARMARDEGTWTAFRHYATDDAVMASPGIVLVQEALKDVPDPAEPIVWGPDLVWSSCSGDYALSTGPATYPSGRKGRFATIWERQADGEYRWVVDQGFELEDDHVQPELIPANVADCSSPRASRFVPTPSADHSAGNSADGSLAWATRIAPDCSRTFMVSVKQGDEMVEIFRRQADAPQAPEGAEAPTCG
ncbi:hypothetical protein [Qipengyuania vesicularis]|uniref:hypothetical protein n=1 Tax=Qipengyuania vesicularis TaxID=2867232 RepID=UPI001C88004D|nr:hypothetical protein [Qipengyuania vesicularis]MBX7528011.1 hypothetical protein [Qipengyuania vesicularis]